MNLEVSISAVEVRVTKDLPKETGRNQGEGCHTEGGLLQGTPSGRGGRFGVVPPRTLSEKRCVLYELFSTTKVLRAEFRHCVH